MTDNKLWEPLWDSVNKNVLSSIITCKFYLCRGVTELFLNKDIMQDYKMALCQETDINKDLLLDWRNSPIKNGQKIRIMHLLEVIPTHAMCILNHKSACLLGSFHHRVFSRKQKSSDAKKQQIVFEWVCLFENVGQWKQSVNRTIILMNSLGYDWIFLSQNFPLRFSLHHINKCNSKCQFLFSALSSWQHSKPPHHHIAVVVYQTHT